MQHVSKKNVAANVNFQEIGDILNAGKVSSGGTEYEGSRSVPGWFLSCGVLRVFLMYAWVLSGFSGFLHLPKNVHVRLIDELGV